MWDFCHPKNTCQGVDTDNCDGYQVDSCKNVAEHTLADKPEQSNNTVERSDLYVSSGAMQKQQSC